MRVSASRISCAARQSACGCRGRGPPMMGADDRRPGSQRSRSGARAAPSRRVTDRCGCCSTRPRRTGSTACSRSSTTAGSTRCSGRRRCARARSSRPRFDERSLRTLDVGAGTGFTTEGIVEHVDAARVTMLDQSPHQLARARTKPSLADCAKLIGDAEALPFPADSFDRYVSAGSIEYWPDPQRAIAEAYRVLRRRRSRRADRAGPAGQPAVAAPRGRVDALPDGGRVPRLARPRRDSPTSSSCRWRRRGTAARAARTPSRRAAASRARARRRSCSRRRTRRTLRPPGRSRALAPRSASPAARWRARCSCRSRRCSRCVTGCRSGARGDGAGGAGAGGRRARVLPGPGRGVLGASPARTP